jgi:glucose/arabinose dehydrogenase
MTTRTPLMSARTRRSLTVLLLLRSRLRGIGSRLVRALVGLALISPGAARAQTFSDPGFAAQTVVTLPPYQLVGTAWTSNGGMFIWQKNGLVRIYRNGALLPTPFIDLRGKVNTVADRGLMSLALDPNFDSNGYVYLAYVYEPDSNPDDTGPKVSRLTRVTADPSNHDVALAGSEVIILDALPVDSGGHNIDMLRFAADGTLFVSNGDGGNSGFTDPAELGALDIDSPRGKVLRINSDGTAPAPPLQTNPYYDGTNSIRSKVFAYGFRNPYRFAVHPTLGDLFLGDVGNQNVEEVDRIVRGGSCP